MMMTLLIEPCKFVYFYKLRQLIMMKMTGNSDDELFKIC